MKKATEHRQNAEECRALARHAHNEDQRNQLLKMADIWELLAVECERMEQSRANSPRGSQPPEQN